MAHYAFLDENNIVTEVITGIEETQLIEGKTPEVWYGEFRGQKCVRTSYNKKIRYNYAGIGYTYNEYYDAFIPPRPFPSWTLSYETFNWVPPTPMPETTPDYRWVWIEENQEWAKLPSNK